MCYFKVFFDAVQPLPDAVKVRVRGHIACVQSDYIGANACHLFFQRCHARFEKGIVFLQLGQVVPDDVKVPKSDIQHCCEERGWGRYGDSVAIR